METRVCIPIEGNLEGYNLRGEISQWLKAQGLARAHDMTEFIWSRKPVYFLRTSANTTDPKYDSSDDWRNEVRYAHFYFRDETPAVLFKLAWGGQ